MGSLILHNSWTVSVVSANNAETCSHGYETFHDHYLQSGNGYKSGTKFYYIGSSVNDVAKGSLADGIRQWDGLAHVRSTPSIMWPYSNEAGNFTSSIQGIDKRNLRHIYC